MFTHEVDEAKGGGPLDELKSELDDVELKDAIFTEGRRITVWYRISEFQLESLKSLAEFTLLQTPRYKGRNELPLYIPGELLSEPLHFSSPVTICEPKKQFD